MTLHFDFGPEARLEAVLRSWQPGPEPAGSLLKTQFAAAHPAKVQLFFRYPGKIAV